MKTLCYWAWLQTDYSRTSSEPFQRRPLNGPLNMHAVILHGACECTWCGVRIMQTYFGLRSAVFFWNIRIHLHFQQLFFSIELTKIESFHIQNMVCLMQNTSCWWRKEYGCQGNNYIIHLTCRITTVSERERLHLFLPQIEVYQVMKHVSNMAVTFYSLQIDGLVQKLHRTHWWPTGIDAVLR